MTTIALDPSKTSDNTVAQVSTGYKSSQAMSSFNAGTMGTYSFPEPKTGLLATIAPSESTWHPLYSHDYREIANHIFSINGLPESSYSADQKQALNNQVKGVVIQSYKQAAMSRCYQIVIIGVLIMLYLLYINTTVKYVLAATVVLAALAWVNAEYYAYGTGEAYWNEFSIDLNSKLQSGMLQGKILEEYANDVNKQLDRAALASQSRGSGYRNTGSSFSGAVVGSLLTNALR